MKQTEKDVRSFALAILETYDLSSLPIDRELALKTITEDLLEDLEDLNTQKVKEIRQARFKAGSPEDYAERIFDLGQGKQVICGIRHQGANPDLPFINAQTNFHIESLAKAKEVSATVSKHFKIFRPKNFCFHSATKLEADSIGTCYLVATAKSYSDISPRGGHHKIQLEPITDDNYYEWYTILYDNFHKESPELKWKVTTCNKNTLDRSLSEGLLFYAKMDNQKIGLIAAKRRPFLGHHGLYFTEILIAKTWKGKGLAKELQRQYVLEHAHDGDFIWGTIDFDNKPSLKTALSNGRKIVRFENFLKLPEFM